MTTNREREMMSRVHCGFGVTYASVTRLTRGVLLVPEIHIRAAEPPPDVPPSQKGRAHLNVGNSRPLATPPDAYI